jgi:uncharacterized cupin superfamily protein
VAEAKLEQTEHGLVPKGPGWYVLNARDATWSAAEARGAYARLEGEPEFEQLGISLVTLAPGEAMAMYHWEADEEDFLVLAGEAVLIVEGEERPLRAWDFVHCPPETAHTIIAGGAEPALIVAVGARRERGSARYPFEPAAAKHGAGVPDEQTSGRDHYATFGTPRPGPAPALLGNTPGP